jgi:pimeloyl-ACP methyl ester carboxylesterase
LEDVLKDATDLPGYFRLIDLFDCVCHDLTGHGESTGMAYNFLNWCEHPGAFPAWKAATAESRTAFLSWVVGHWNSADESEIYNTTFLAFVWDCFAQYATLKGEMEAEKR